MSAVEPACPSFPNTPEYHHTNDCWRWSGSIITHSRLPLVPKMVMEQGRIGTVFILTSGSDSSAKQLEYAEVMFKEQLGLSQVTTPLGVNSDDKKSFPSGPKTGPTSSMTWILAFGPKILSTLKRSGIKPDEPEPSSRSFKDTSWRRPLHIRRNFPSGLW